jgi:ABC-2 type transport system permease protein
VSRRTFTTARRVLTQLRHDPRTVALLILVPCLLETLLRLIYANHLAVFNQVGAPLLAFFPLTTVFLVTSISLLRERTGGTLERLMTTPLGGSSCWSAMPWRSACSPPARPESSAP